MNTRRAFRRGIGLVVHNWPLKVAAIALATFLYAGFVASQDASTIQGPITVNVQPGTQPADTVITNQLRDVDSIRYVAPAGTQRPRPSEFRATIDLTNVQPDGQTANVPVRVSALDPDITILSVTPSTVQVVLERSATKQVPVRLERGPAPEGIQVGSETYEPQTVLVRGPASAVARVVSADVQVALDPEGFDVDREIEARPVDANRDPVTGVEVEPATVHVQIPLYTNKESRTLPVNAVVTGVPAPGFRVESVTVSPPTVTVEGDAEQLTPLVAIDTVPLTIAGATADVREAVDLAPPTGVEPVGAASVTVAVHIVPVTETRTLAAGLRLDGQDPDLVYDLNVEQVLLTLFGSVADLDRLASGALVVGIDVRGLGVGDHEVAVVPEIDSAVTVASISPQTVVVTVSEPAPSPINGAGVTPGGTATPVPEPSASP